MIEDSLVDKTLEELNQQLKRLAKTLRPNHWKFAKLLAEGQTIESAYRDAISKKTKTARSSGSRLMATNANISHYVEVSKQVASKQVIDGLEITEERIMKELACLGMYDMRKLYDQDGRMLDPHELDANTARAVSKVKETVVYRKVTNNEEGTETEDRQTIRREYEMADKKGALQLLGNSRAIQMFREHKVVSNGLESLLDELTGGSEQD